NINSADNVGTTALAHAVAHDRLGSVQLLLSYPDIDVNLGFPLASASEDYFCQDGRPFHAGHKNQIAALLLSRLDFDVNAVDDSGKAAWHSVAKNLDFDALQLLLARDDFDPSSTESQCTWTSADVCYSIHNNDVMTVEGSLNVVLILRTLDQDHRFALDDFY